MYLRFFSVSFIFFAVLFSLLFSIQMILEDKIKKSVFKDIYVPALGGLLEMYILNALILVFLEPDLVSKLIIFLFGLSPLIIGKFATYQKVQFYSIIQIGVIILSCLFV